MINFGTSLGKAEREQPYVASMLMSVQGKISSYNRGKDFGLYVNAGLTDQLIYDTDFTWLRDDNMAWSVSNRNLFYGGGSPSADLVPVNQLGYSIIEFVPDTVFKIEDLTIGGRPSAGSTQFRFVFFDQHGHELHNTGGHKTVTDTVTWHLGIDL